MKKYFNLRNVVAIAICLAGTTMFSGCGSKKTNDTENTAKTEEKSDFIEFDKLKKKNGIYYFNNVPFTGKAQKDGDCREKWEMKDGKFHGKYEGGHPNGVVSGNYKNGEKHGEWQQVFWGGANDDSCTEIQHYKDGKKHGEWQYLFNDELYKTETYKNDKLIKEWTKEDEEMQEMIDFDKLVLKGDVYYLNNKPFTGKAGYQKEMHESWEFKDGKYHGKYEYYMDGCTTIGNYRNGKKHGKWEGWCYDYDEDKKIDYNTEMWENGEELISK